MNLMVGYPKTALTSGATRSLLSNDRFLLKPILPPTLRVPRMVVAVEDKSLSGEDDESLSDTSSCKDSELSVSHRSGGPTQMHRQVNVHRANPDVSVKLSVPVGKPLRPKPRLVKSNFLKKRSIRESTTKATVPLKSAINKSTVLKRSSLSQDEKLFLEAAATLVRSSAPKQQA